MKYILGLIRLSVVTLSLVPVFITAQESSEQDFKKNIPSVEIDSFFAPWNDRNKPGIAVGVVFNGQIMRLKGYGSADIEKDILITKDTKFYFHGLIDQLTVMSIHLLQADGQLELNDPLIKYFPELSHLIDKMQIKHLFHHTSGLIDISGLKVIAGFNAESTFNKSQAINLLKTQSELLNAPGKVFAKNRTGIALLQEIVEIASGQTFDSYLQKTDFSTFGNE